MFTRIALVEITDPFHLLGLRFAFAAITLSLCIMLKLVTVDFQGKKLSRLLFLSAFQPISYFIFETFGIARSTASQAGVMIAFVPVAVSLLAMVFLKERTNGKQMFFIAMSILGVLIINSDVRFSSSNMLGNLLLLGAVFSASVYQILSRKYSTNFTPIEITFVMMWVGAIAFNFIGIRNTLQTGSLGDYLAPLQNPNLLGSLLYLGVLSSVVAFFFQNYVLSKVQATKAAILANLTTVIAIFAGVFILHESFDLIKLIGSAMILLGVYGTTKVRSRQAIE
jgi:drug/metabolite transporter (DMT)-like permease